MDTLIAARADLAMKDEDLRIARKHREQAAGRIMTPENERAYHGALAWEDTCAAARSISACHLRNVLQELDDDEDGRCNCGGTLVFERDTSETRCDLCGKEG